VARIEEARPRHRPEPQREIQRERVEETDGSHLPAFLLRPVRLKA
jgi:hypothetical protein